MAVTTAEEIAEAAAWVGLLGFGYGLIGKDRLRRRRQERRARRRSRGVEAAAVEAALTDEIFAPDRVRAAVRTILTTVPDDRCAADATQDASRGDGLMIERWRAQRGITGEMQLADEPQIDLLRIADRSEESEDRVVVRVRTAFRAAAGSQRGPKISIDDRWTLARAHGTWEIVEFDVVPLAEELLTSSIIVGGWDDDARLREQSLIELTDEDRPASDDLVATDLGPHHQLLDLAVADARFSPALLQATLSQLVDAWEQATIGQGERLAQRASSQGRDELLYAVSDGERLQFVLRDAQLREWRPTQVRAAQLALEVKVSGVRFVADPHTGRVRHGSDEVAHDIQMVWTLERSSDATPWRLCHSTSPAREIPGVLE